MKMLLSIAVLCGLAGSGCTSGLVYASPSIKGVVVDARTHRPVSGARIELINSSDTALGRSSVTAASNARGRFRLAARRVYGKKRIFGDPDDFAYDVRITKPGYRAFDASRYYPLELSPPDPVILDATLEPKPSRR